MKLETPLTAHFNLELPVVQAPLAGGGDTPELVAAVCGAGGLGSVGAAYLDPDAIERAAAAVRARTDRPFAINLFAPQPELPHGWANIVTDQLASYHHELGMTTPSPIAPAAYSFDDQFEVVLSLRPAVFSFTLGLLPKAMIEAVKATGAYVMGTATSVSEALALEASGVDAVVVQGSEAGGHRATFIAEDDTGMIGTMALVPQVVDALHIPVVASGGIMDGRGVAAALALGASGAQLGTAFLVCDEAGTPQAYREAILAADEVDTRITRVFSGRPARGLANRFMREMERSDDTTLPFPLQNALTRPLRSAAARMGRAEFLSLWAGQGVTLARPRSAAQLIADLKVEMTSTIQRLHNLRTTSGATP
jgi:nitronate monooxygenase